MQPSTLNSLNNTKKEVKGFLVPTATHNKNVFENESVHNLLKIMQEYMYLFMNNKFRARMRYRDLPRLFDTLRKWLLQIHRDFANRDGRVLVKETEFFQENERKTLLDIFRSIITSENFSKTGESYKFLFSNMETTCEAYVNSLNCQQ